MGLSVSVQINGALQTSARLYDTTSGYTSAQRQTESCRFTHAAVVQEEAFCVLHKNHYGGEKPQFILTLIYLI